MGDTEKIDQGSGVESRIIRAPGGLVDQTLEIIKQMASEELPVLIFGPTGTGKELFSDYLVESSPRSEAPYNKLNCIGFPFYLFLNKEITAMATKPIAKMINMIIGPFSMLPPEKGLHI